MDLLLHNIDPKGDVLLVLRNPNAPLAVWTDSASSPVSPAPDFSKLLAQKPQDAKSGKKMRAKAKKKARSNLSFESVDPGYEPMPSPEPEDEPAPIPVPEDAPLSENSLDLENVLESDEEPEEPAAEEPAVKNNASHVSNQVHPISL